MTQIACADSVTRPNFVIGGTDWFTKTGHAPRVARVRPEQRTGALAGGVGITFPVEPGSKKFVGDGRRRAYLC
jgi:hypothetical protein